MSPRGTSAEEALEIVAMDHDLDPSLVTLMVGLGIPLSFAALPAWWWLLQAAG